MTKGVTKRQNKAKSSKATNVKDVVQTNKPTILTPGVTISIEKINNEDCSISTPITASIQKDNRKIISYTKVKEILDMFTNSFVDYGNYLCNKYVQENNDSQYERLMKKSYLRNVRFILNPTWVDMNHDYEYPDYRTIDGMNSLFYMISEEKKNSWLFQTVETFEKNDQLSDEMIMEAFKALLDGLYHEEFMANNDRAYSYFTYYMNVLKYVFDKKNKDYTQNIYHIGSLLQIKDEISSLYQEYTNVEACIATKNLVMAIHSLTAMKQNNIFEAISSIGLDTTDIKMYVNFILTPFFGTFYALRHLDMEDYLNEIDSNIYNHMCLIKPHPSWIDEDDDVDQEEYRREREEAMNLQRAKRALEEEARKRVIDSIPVYDLPRAPAQILNKRFAQKLEEEKAAAAAAAAAAATASVKYSPTASVNSRASAFVTENSSVLNSPTSTVVSDNTNKPTYVPYDFVFEENKIPKSIRRNEKNETNGRDTGFLIFHAGSTPDHVYERAAIATHGGRFKCAIKDVCNELPRLLVEKEKFLRKSRDKVFGRSLEELFTNDVKQRKLYYTNLRRAIISFCNEIAATHRLDNDGRMAIVEKYYGPRKSDETEKMYIDSFMADVFRPFINFYNYAKSL
jgi:hypothetical protein